MRTEKEKYSGKDKVLGRPGNEMHRTLRMQQAGRGLSRVPEAVPCGHK